MERDTETDNLKQQRYENDRPFQENDTDVFGATCSGRCAICQELPQPCQEHRRLRDLHSQLRAAERLQRLHGRGDIRASRPLLGRERDRGGQAYPMPNSREPCGGTHRRGKGGSTAKRNPSIPRRGSPQVAEPPQAENRNQSDHPRSTTTLII